MTDKYCVGCKEEKDLGLFGDDKNSKDGHNRYCKECCRKKCKEYRTNLGPGYNDRVHQWNRENKEASDLRHLKYRLKKFFNITLEEYCELLKKQNFGCAICGYVPQKGEPALHIDHDHTTGKIRGLLCFPHNALLGLAHDDTDSLNKCIHYLTRNSLDCPNSNVSENNSVNTGKPKSKDMVIPSQDLQE